MISIICVYNDEDIFRNWLLQSLEKQTADYELIALNNAKGGFQSAAQAYNYGVRQIKQNSNYIMFVHQDIDLLSETWLEEVEKILDQMPAFGITGVAGKTEKTNNFLTNIVHGTAPPGKPGLPEGKPVELMTVDECLFIIPRKIFNIYPLDEQLCDGWHLYAVEYCLRMKRQSLAVRLLPVVVHHKSQGSIDREYFKSLEKVLGAYRTHYEKINTTCGQWHTRIPLRLQCMQRSIMQKIRGFFRILIDRGLVPECVRRKNRERLWLYLKSLKK